MKIGAGGLQSLAAQELTQKYQAQETRIKPVVEEAALRVPEGRKILGPELNKAVEHLNKVSEMYNYNLKFSVSKENGKEKVQLLDEKTGEAREIKQEQLSVLAEQLQTGKGINLDDYV